MFKGREVWESDLTSREESSRIDGLRHSMSRGIDIFWATLVVAAVALGLLRITPLVSTADSPAARIISQPLQSRDAAPGEVTVQPTIVEAESASDLEVVSPLESLPQPAPSTPENSLMSPLHSPACPEFLPIPGIDVPIQR